MSRIIIFIYGVLSYAIGMGGLTYFILFVGGWSFLPRHIESGTPGPLIPALLINAALVVLFGLQHSVMARPGFKRMWTQVVPKAAERSTYVLLSGIMMLVLCFGWQPIAGTLWHVQDPTGSAILTGVYIFGWVLAVVATFVINHFELFGLQQIYVNLRNQPMPKPHFTSRFLYSMVRHPLQLGILIGVWATAHMSMTHLFLSVTMTCYILTALYFEERDLVAALGKEYEEYRTRVPKLIPLTRPARPSAEGELTMGHSTSGD